MLPVLPIGPISLPTAPFFAILALWFGLDFAGRYGKRFGLDPNEIWNIGLISLCTGLIVARLWNVVQFWSIYLSEPTLILSIRPSGFALWPGLIAALIAGYGYLLIYSINPLHVIASFSIGLLAAGIIFSISGYLTGTILGTTSTLPWALPYYGELRHPTALYQAFGLLLVLALLWYQPKGMHAGRVVLFSLLGYSLLRLLTDTFTVVLDGDGMLLGGFRVSQIVGLLVGCFACFLLARIESNAPNSMINE